MPLPTKTIMSTSSPSADPWTNPRDSFLPPRPVLRPPNREDPESPLLPAPNPTTAVEPAAEGIPVAASLEQQSTTHSAPPAEPPAPQEPEVIPARALRFHNPWANQGLFDHLKDPVTGKVPAPAPPLQPKRTTSKLEQDKEQEDKPVEVTVEEYIAANAAALRPGSGESGELAGPPGRRSSSDSNSLGFSRFLTDL